ncbi:acylphosphatase [Dyella tabacisoli]|uniref:acylphosphatase n=1 Tax=Dyella tabacisoli TaxID=2282381 RepID=A0A369UQU8_9GAMM|nr:acylphosphatase [Dyella tabacisoli]RDD83016.1 acylphosphatase [Dyella tabacisoli]
MSTVKFIVSGRVQGVFYRASTREQALELGLTGHAKNLADGSVEVLACGSGQAIEALERWLWHGPPAAKVEAVSQEYVQMPPPSGFVVG